MAAGLERSEPIGIMMAWRRSRVTITATGVETLNFGELAGRGRDGQRRSHMGLAACRAVGGARRGRPRRRGHRRWQAAGTSGGC